MSARPTFLRVACLLAATSSLVACGGKTGQSPLPPPGPDAGPDLPGSNTDVDAPGPAPDLPLAASCKTGLLGAAPFGAQVSGTGTFPNQIAASTAAPITSTMTAYLYFPAGRVAGGQALLAMQSRVVQGLYFFGSPVTIAGDLSATGLAVSGHDETITADLLPGSDGLRAKAIGRL